MSHTPAIVVTLAVLAALSGIVYVNANREDETTVSAPQANHTETPIVAASERTETPAQPASSRQNTTDDIARLSADTQSNDAKTRAAAIAALASAPKAQAIPALERVLESGEPQVDRQIALQSLHTLALKHGDENSRIRDVIRHAMYHSDDEGVTQSAQAILEDIEAALAQN
jgi:HEAT repeat protein